MSYKYVQIIIFSSLILLLTVIEIKAQEIYFSSPMNGQEVTNVHYSSTQVYVIIDYVYTKSSNPNYIYKKTVLVTDSNTYSSFDEGGIPLGLDRLPGTYTWRIELYEGNVIGQMFKTAEQSITFTVKFPITVSNNIGM